MFTKIILSATATAAAFAAVPAVAAPAGCPVDPLNLVCNGSFEDTGTQTGNFEFDAQAGATAGKLTGWSSAGGYNLLFHASTANSAAGNAAGQYAGTGREYMWASTADKGDNFVALDGDPAFSSAMTQTINGLTVGQSYTLTFDWAAGQIASRTGATTEQLQVGFGSDIYKTNVISNPSMGFSGWQTASTSFTAKSTSQLLSFLSIGTPSGLPPVALLDNVKLTASVPEPASWAMMIGGFGFIGAAMRRSRRAQVAFA